MYIVQYTKYKKIMVIWRSFVSYVNTFVKLTLSLYDPARWHWNPGPQILMIWNGMQVRRPADPAHSTVFVSQPS